MYEFKDNRLFSSFVKNFHDEKVIGLNEILQVFFIVYKIFTKEVPHPFVASGSIIFVLLKNTFFIYVFL